MTPKEKTIVKSLVVVAWADGSVKEPEQGIIEGLLWAFGAEEADEKEILEYAKKKRTLKDDIPVSELERADRELLLAHAALLTHADGKQTKGEEKILKSLIGLLEISDADAKPILQTARERAKKLAERM
ncbi:MAG TPA: TerB family tellurite resistance protein [Polyangiaceae bacterium]|nr:TerB family tellurite resistance protein [Polyangiaceae bacterium]